jgi:hypothetical protein
MEFDPVRVQWANPHRDDRLQRLAECFLAAYLEKRKSQEGIRLAAS